MADCPCKHCSERHEVCHDKCDRYQAWKSDRAEMLNKERLSRDGYTDHDNQPFWKKQSRNARTKRGQ